MRIHQIWEEVETMAEEMKRDVEDDDGEFSEEQLALLDGLLAQQSSEEREAGRAMASILPSLF